MENEQKSDAYQVVKLIYRGGWQATGKSFQRLNSSLFRVLDAAIDAGLRFDEDDFSKICKDFRGGYWFGIDNDQNYGERFFRTAVEANNISACISFEKFAHRKPFNIENRRIYIGRDFIWKDLRVVCTSFHPEGKYVVACSYEKYYGHGKFVRGDGKPIKIFKITQNDLKEHRAELREKAKAA
jgi:hypothetical protein